MENQGINRTEVILIIGILLILATLLLSALSALASVKETGGDHRCQNKLKQIGTSLATYSNDYGRCVRYPDANGAYFLGRLYKVGLLTDSKVYLCPNTRNDNNQNRDLGADFGIQPDWISYAGRKNKVQTVYPGLFRATQVTTMTSVASDDWEAGPNHENGQLIRFLFLDGHVDHQRNTTLTGDDYNAFVKWGLADPLTN